MRVHTHTSEAGREEGADREVGADLFRTLLHHLMAGLRHLVIPHQTRGLLRKNLLDAKRVAHLANLPCRLAMSACRRRRPSPFSLHACLPAYRSLSLPTIRTRSVSLYDTHACGLPTGIARARSPCGRRLLPPNRPPALPPSLHANGRKQHDLIALADNEQDGTGYSIYVCRLHPLHLLIKCLAYLHICMHTHAHAMHTQQRSRTLLANCSRQR